MILELNRQARGRSLLETDEFNESEKRMIRENNDGIIILAVCGTQRKSFFFFLNVFLSQIGVGPNKKLHLSV
jgi:hypothetical protein